MTNREKQANDASNSNKKKRCYNIYVRILW